MVRVFKMYRRRLPKKVVEGKPPDQKKRKTNNNMDTENFKAVSARNQLEDEW